MNTHRQRQQAPPESSEPDLQVRFDRPGPDGRVVDPVCFMRVLRNAPYRAEQEGTTYHFCSERCLRKFQENPKWYVSSAIRRKILKSRQLPPGPESEPVFAVQSSNAGGAQDPVCQMTVSADSPHWLEHQGRLYRFCAGRCLEKFRAWPERYVSGSERKG